MRFTRTVLTIVALALLSLPCLADEPSNVATQPSAVGMAASKPASGPATSSGSKIPDEVLKKIQTILQGQPTVTIAQDMVKLCEDAEKQYPTASDLYRVQVPMLQAQVWLASQGNDPAAHKKMLDIAQRIVNGDAPAKEKVSAEALLIIAKIYSPTGEGADKNMLAKEIKAMVARYENTDAAPNALILGIRVSSQAGLSDLMDEYGKILAEKYPTAEGAKAILRDMGKGPDIGKPFEAELTKLDGSKLSLPKDMLGKVVVVDFWATWCPPCVAAIPHMKEVYAKYKDSGVVFLGVSLDQDEDKAKLEKFVADNGMDWTQTFSGKFWDDPTAKKYDVRGIPDVWVIGMDGKVVSDNAGENLELMLDKALKTETTTKPTASAPASSSSTK